MKIGLVNCRDLPEPDIDEAPLIDALRAAGHDAGTLAWDDPSSDPGAFDLCVLRATWNIHLQPLEFLEWLENASRRSRICNAHDVVRWNLDKRYLIELQSAGIPIVPTAWATRSARTDLRSIVDATGWSEVVIKPIISAASFMTRRFRTDAIDAAQQFLSDALTERDMMVQQYMPSVEHGGERAIVWIDGKITHAVEKAPRFADNEERVSGRDVTPEEQTFAERVMRSAPDGLLYARIDVMEDEEGSLRLSELELIEPSLYFPFSEAALARFVRAVSRMGEDQAVATRE